MSCNCRNCKVNKSHSKEHPAPDYSISLSFRCVEGIVKFPIYCACYFAACDDHFTVDEVHKPIEIDCGRSVLIDALRYAIYSTPNTDAYHASELKRWKEGKLFSIYPHLKIGGITGPKCHEMRLKKRNFQYLLAVYKVLQVDLKANEIWHFHKKHASMMLEKIDEEYEIPNLRTGIVQLGLNVNKYEDWKTIVDILEGKLTWEEIHERTNIQK